MKKTEPLEEMTDKERQEFIAHLWKVRELFEPL